MGKRVTTIFLVLLLLLVFTALNAAAQVSICMPDVSVAQGVTAIDIQ